MITEPGLYWITTKRGWKGHANVIEQDGELVLHIRVTKETFPLDSVNKILQESRRIA